MCLNKNFFRYIVNDDTQLLPIHTNENIIIVFIIKYKTLELIK